MLSSRINSGGRINSTFKEPNKSKSIQFYTYKINSANKINSTSNMSKLILHI
jgi:hypothetical protein